MSPSENTLIDLRRVGPARVLASKLDKAAHGPLTLIDPTVELSVQVPDGQQKLAAGLVRAAIRADAHNRARAVRRGARKSGGVWGGAKTDEAVSAKDGAEMVRLHVSDRDKWSYDALGAKFKKKPDTVYRHLKDAGVVTRGRGRPKKS